MRQASRTCLDTIAAGMAMSLALSFPELGYAVQLLPVWTLSSEPSADDKNRPCWHISIHCPEASCVAEV